MDRQVVFVILVVIPMALIVVPLSLAAWRRRREQRATSDLDDR